jgi:hypothetical protein
VNEKVIKNLIKSNYFKIQFKNSKKNILLIDRGSASTAIMNSLFSYILNKKYSFDIDLLYSKTKKNEMFKIFKSFGINKNFNINIKDNLNNINLMLLTTFDFFYSFSKIIFFGKSWFIKNFMLKGIYFGDIIYDNHIRYELKFLNKSILNKDFLKLLYISIFKINFLDKIISKENYNYIIASSHGYASNPAIGMRIALKKNIKVINILSSRLRIYTKLYQAMRHETHFDLEYLKDKKIFNKDWIKKFNIMIKNRYAGKIEFRATKESFYKKKNIDKDSFLKIFNFNKKSFKRIVFFAPHCFSDANHIAGRLVFDDYYEQFKKTIAFAKKDQTSLWIIKIHPSSARYKEEDLIYKLLHDTNSKNIVVCPNKFNSFSLIKFADLIVTGRGTVGLEAACFGKKPLLAGEHFYSKFGITHNSINKKDYIKKLSNPKIQVKLTKKQILTAKKLFYLLVFKNSHTKKDKFLRPHYYLSVDIKRGKIFQDFLNENDFVNEITKKLNKKVYLTQDRIFQKNFLPIFNKSEKIKN